MSNFLSKITNQIGIDLGSSYTRVWHNHTGFLPPEATCIAIDQQNKVIAVGNDALEMKDKVSDQIKVIFPVNQGEMIDIEITKAFLIVLLKKIFKIGTFFRPIVMISVPTGFLPSQRQVSVDEIYEIGASRVLTISQSLSAVIGAGVPIADANGTFVTHLGASRVETATISLGSIVDYLSSSRAGNYFDQSLSLFLKKKYGLNLGRAQIYKIKSQVLDTTLHQDLTVSGHDLKTNLPVEKVISLSQVEPVAKGVLSGVEKMINQLLSTIPPDFTSDILDKGMLLTGGMAQMKGLDVHLSQALNIPVSLVDESDKAVIKGISIAMQNIDEFSKSLGYKIN